MRRHLARFVDDRVDVVGLPNQFQRFMRGLNIKPAVCFKLN
jgi:hypothetical protein